MGTALSFGTRVWIAELLRAGWTGRVDERRNSTRYRLTLADDLEQVCREVSSVSHGVVVEDGGSCVFVPCESREAAVWLLEQAIAEAA